MIFWAGSLDFDFVYFFVVHLPFFPVLFIFSGDRGENEAFQIKTFFKCYTTN